MGNLGCSFTFQLKSGYVVNINDGHVSEDFESKLRPDVGELK